MKLSRRLRRDMERWVDSTLVFMRTCQAEPGLIVNGPAATSEEQAERSRVLAGAALQMAQAMLVTLHQLDPERAARMDQMLGGRPPDASC